MSDKSTFCMTLFELNSRRSKLIYSDQKQICGRLVMEMYFEAVITNRREETLK